MTGLRIRQASVSGRRVRKLRPLTLRPPFESLPGRAPDGSQQPPSWLTRLAAFILRILKRRPGTFGP